MKPDPLTETAKQIGERGQFLSFVRDAKANITTRKFVLLKFNDQHGYPHQLEIRTEDFMDFLNSQESTALAELKQLMGAV